MFHDYKDQHEIIDILEFLLLHAINIKVQYGYESCGYKQIDKSNTCLSIKFNLQLSTK